MKKFLSKQGPLLRAVVIVATVGIVVTGVTFASLQAQPATLAGNTIQSATVGLTIGTASATSTAYSSSHSGFSFTGVVPGGPASPVDGNTFYLKNTGSASLNLKLAISSTPTNTSSVDLAKVSVQLTRVDTGTTQTATLQSLVDGYPAGGLTLIDSLAPASTGTQYKISVSMAADAFTGTSASIGSIDFIFSGTAVTAAQNCLTTADLHSIVLDTLVGRECHVRNNVPATRITRLVVII